MAKLPFVEEITQKKSQMGVVVVCKRNRKRLRFL
jgi:hypothetical protein